MGAPLQGALALGGEIDVQSSLSEARQALANNPGNPQLQATYAADYAAISADIQDLLVNPTTN